MTSTGVFDVKPLKLVGNALPWPFVKFATANIYPLKTGGAPAACSNCDNSTM